MEAAGDVERWVEGWRVGEAGGGVGRLLEVWGGWWCGEAGGGVGRNGGGVGRLVEV